MESVPMKRINLLSIDGGSSGLPGLYTMDEILARLAFDLKSDEELMAWRHFELMIGTGPGGLVVILIGRLRLSPSQAIEAYMKLEAVMRTKPAKDDEERSRNSTAFRTAFIEVLKEAGFEADTPMVDENMPKIIVCTSNTANVSVVHPIRSYRTRGALSPSCTILQAACACVASPDTFDPVTIGVGHKRAVLIDAMVGSANPAKELLREAQNAFGEDAEVASIVSVGAGKRDVGVVFEDGREVGISDGLRRGIATCEQVHEDLQSRFQKAGIYHRFNIEQEIGIQPEVVLAHVSTYLGATMTSARVDSAVENIHRRLTGVKLRDINSIAVIEVTLKPRPSVIKNFVGREDILEAMRRTHLSERSTNSHDTAVTVLSGLGGAGKTQTALKFALEFEDKSPDAPVYFVNASAEETLKADFENIIRSRGARYRTASHQDALIWLATKPDDWLVIMDNADDPLFRLLPYIAQSSRGNIIITTRNANQAMLAPNSSHHLEGLSMEDAINLILTASGCEDTEANRELARAIVEELGRLPLALAQAAGYIFVNQCLPTYLILYRRSTKRLLTARPSELPYNYPSSVAGTIQMSLDRLPIRVFNILLLFAHLDSTSIPHAIIDRAAERKFRRVERTKENAINTKTQEHADALVEIFYVDGEWSEVDFNDLITCCQQYSLLRLTTQGGSKFYSMHILVQSYLRAKEDAIKGHRPGPLIVRILSSSSTYSSNYKYLAFNRLLLPHLRQIQMVDVVEAGDHFGFGNVVWTAGDTKLAVLHLERCVEIWRRSLGDEHRNTLAAMGNLSAYYAGEGRFQKALELDEKVLNVQKTTLGAEHRNTLQTMGRLADSYIKLGRNGEAVEMFEKVLEAQRRILGPEHAHTADTMGNLAVTYVKLGRNQEALELEEQVLEIQKRTLSPEDPDTLWTMINLADSYRIIGRKQESLKLNQQALEMQKRVLGDEHPNTIYSMRFQLDILRDLGMTEQLRSLLRVALPAHEKVLGMGHPDTLWLKEEFRMELALL